ncbi:DUF4913 domain-containing protein [Gordonia sp. NPDC057258]|uniref:DUF4913 domain-containing protein n=1 Tax=unclassified Gordonia (in: high G+C Gram-positive bacteria) TaxID=2657482 RepID=UPI00362F8BC7
MTTHDTDTPDDDNRAHWRFTSGADWFTNWLSHIKAGRFDRDTRWCAQWWRHDEVVIRLEELWKAWETARLSEDPAALSSWWTAHLDAHWRTLTAENGPLYLCTPEKHTATDTLTGASTPPPPGWFDPPADHTTAA